MAARAQASEQEVCYLWPCNVTAWERWCEVQTQWRYAMSGATGLCYDGVRSHLDECGHAAGDERKAIWAGIQAAERATLDAWAELAKAKQDQQP